MHQPAGLLARLAQRVEETLAIGVVVEDRLAAVSAIEQVVNRAGILNPQFSRHESRLKWNAVAVNCVIMYD